MHSIRTKTTLLTVCAIVVAMTVSMLLGVIAIRNIGSDSADQMLLLLCQAGEKNLDAYFESVEQSVEMVSAFAGSDLAETQIEDLAAHVARVGEIFRKAARMTNGVLTYYYRIDPEVSDAVEGFWYVNLDGDGFISHAVTDITRYDVQDTSKLVWFTVPRATGESIWLPPYVTDNLDVRVLSYNVPIYKGERFIGVIGMEIDYSTVASQVDSIKLYENGYAFINDAHGNIVYHPHIDVTRLSQDELPAVPDSLMSESTFVRYRYDGMSKQAVWLPLSNGMRLNVTVPIAEINAGWHKLVYMVFAVSVVLLALFVTLTMRFTGRITRPLAELTQAAEQVNEGNYDFTLEYDGDDEVGLLTRTFRRLTSHLKVYINYLNDLAYADALTSVRNKGAYDTFMRQLQVRMGESDAQPEFAVALFDCDDLTAINERYGHDKGDLYLKAASKLICDVFQHSPVFRTGKSTFTALLENEDYRNREALADLFRDRCAQSGGENGAPWEQVCMAMGIAAYDPQLDATAEDVARRADGVLIENRRAR